MDADVTRRLEASAAEARAAEARGDDDAAGEAWRRHRLIRDGTRDPEDLIAEGIALSVMARALSEDA